MRSVGTILIVAVFMLGACSSSSSDSDSGSSGGGSTTTSTIDAAAKAIIGVWNRIKTSDTDNDVWTDQAPGSSLVYTIGADGAVSWANTADFQIRSSAEVKTCTLTGTITVAKDLKYSVKFTKDTCVPGETLDPALEDTGNFELLANGDLVDHSNGGWADWYEKSK